MIGIRVAYNTTLSVLDQGSISILFHLVQVRQMGTGALYGLMEIIILQKSKIFTQLFPVTFEEINYLIRGEPI